MQQDIEDFTKDELLAWVDYLQTRLEETQERLLWAYHRLEKFEDDGK